MRVAGWVSSRRGVWGRRFGETTRSAGCASFSDTTNRQQGSTSSSCRGVNSWMPPLPFCWMTIAAHLAVRCEPTAGREVEPSERREASQSEFQDGPLIAAWVLLLKGYRVVISPLFAGSCRFEPSCSHYAEEAVRRHGSLGGFWLTLRRLGRCHPFHAGGYDPVPPRASHPGRRGC